MLANRFAYLTLTQFGEDISHPELIEYLPIYKMIRDCLDNRIKEQGLTYLPDPSEGNMYDADHKKRRYANYLQRACFVPVTRRTRDGLVAQVFIRAPSVTYPPDKENVLKKITRKGTTVQALANASLGEAVSFGRCAIVVTYSDVSMKPSLNMVQPEDVLTWSETPDGAVDGLGRNVASATVRMFFDVQDTDGVSIKKVAQLTQYSLSKQGVVWFRTKTSDINSALGSSFSTKWSEYQLLRVAGEPVDHVPVFPIGSVENTFDIQAPPLGEMATLNLSHYINSADYEEFAKLAGQVTPIFSGLKDSWYRDHIEGKVMFGMRTPVGLNEGATASLLQAQPNSVAKEAMDKKEALMVGIGARIIEERKIRRTATESSLEDRAYHSILGHIAMNVTSAINDALNFLSMYYKMPNAAFTLTLNTDFSTISSDAEHRRLLLEEYVAGVRTFEEYRDGLRTYDSNVGTDDEKAKKTILSEAKDFKKVIAESTITKSQENTPKGDNRTQPPKNEKD